MDNLKKKKVGRHNNYFEDKWNAFQLYKLRHSYSPKITKADCKFCFIIIICIVSVMVQLKFDNHI